MALSSCLWPSPPSLSRLSAGAYSRRVETLRRFRASKPSLAYGHGMGHVVFAIAFFVGLCLLVEWVFQRLDEKRDDRKRF